MSKDERLKLQAELRFLEEEKKRITDLMKTLPDLEVRKHQVILKLNPHHAHY